MKAGFLAGLAAALIAASLPVAARAQTAPDQVVVRAIHNEAELSYAGFLRSYAQLYQLLPPEPRHIDLFDRILFTRLSPAEQEAFTSPTWAIAVVSHSRDIEIPIVRGGYFLLPYDRVAMEEDAKIMFNAHTQDGVLGLAVGLRTQPGAVIHAADLATALKEANSFHDKAIKTPLYKGTVHFNAIKACFGTTGGDMVIARGAGSKSTLGICTLYVPAAGDVATDAEISFSAEPEIVLLLPVQQ